AGIEQMPSRVLGAADVQVDRQPMVDLVAGRELAVIVRIGEAEEVPGGAGSTAHGVCLAARRTTAPWAGGVHELRHGGERRLARIWRLIALNLRQEDGKLLFGYGH